METFQSHLTPYRQVQGSAPNHALTEYYLDIFQIELTLDGYLFLQRKIKTDQRLVWFSIADMASGETTDGKIPYIKALYNDFSDDRSALEAGLTALPDSFSCRYLFNQTKYVTLPIDYRKPVLAGKLGKGKSLDLNLTAGQLSILLGLAAYLRGFEFATVQENVVFHPYGWIEVANNPTIQSELISLAALLNGSDLIIENHRDSLFRLSISPEAVFFLMKSCFRSQ